MSDLPYLPLWVSDYEAKTAHLSFEEDGAYSRLLRLAWTCPGGTLPHDDAWLMRRLRSTEEFYDRVVRPVLKEFFSVRRGRYVNDRLKREFDLALEKTARRKAAGKTGGEAKARKTKEKHSSNATVLPEQKLSKSEPKPEPESIVDDEDSGAIDFDALQAKCRKWANGSLNLTVPSAHTLDPIIRLLTPAGGGKPCIEQDVERGITRTAAWLHSKGRQVSSLSYFEKSIIEARDERLRPNPEVNHDNANLVGGEPRRFGSDASGQSAARHASGGRGALGTGQHGRGSIADAAIRRHLQRQNGDGVPGGDERGSDISAGGDVIDGDYRLVG